MSLFYKTVPRATHILVGSRESGAGSRETRSRMRIAFTALGLVFGVLAAMGAQVHGQAPAALPASVAALSWMAGAWGGTADGIEMEEHWTSAKGGSLIGMHRDIAKGRTVSFEFLRVEEQNAGL